MIKRVKNRNVAYKVICVLSLFVLALLFFLIYFLSQYPIRFKSLIIRYSNKYNLDKIFVSSVINVESGFNAKCESVHGAVGLMQLLPTTAIEIASKIGVEEYDLLEPEINIEFGCFYLRYLLNYYENDLDKTICAYNAGLNNVNQWINDSEIYDDSKFINIPFYETKNYLKKVHSSIRVYNFIFNLM